MLGGERVPVGDEIGGGAGEPYPPAVLACARAAGMDEANAVAGRSDRSGSVGAGCHDDDVTTRWWSAPGLTLIGRRSHA